MIFNAVIVNARRHFLVEVPAVPAVFPLVAGENFIAPAVEYAQSVGFDASALSSENFVVAVAVGGKGVGHEQRGAAAIAQVNAVADFAACCGLQRKGVGAALALVALVGHGQRVALANSGSAPENLDWPNFEKGRLRQRQ